MSEMIPGYEGSTAILWWVVFLIGLGLAPHFKPFGCALDPARAAHPLQMPFAVMKTHPNMAYAPIHVFRMAIGPIGAFVGSAYAGYVGKYSGTLDQDSEAWAFAAYVLFPFGIMNGVQHVQMFYERVVCKNQLWDFPMVAGCLVFQSLYTFLLLRWVGLVKATGAHNAEVMVNAVYLHISVFVITNLLRLFFLSQNGFKGMTKNFVQPTCPVMKKVI